MLTAAPALHSLIVRERWDVLDILKFLHRKHCDLRKLIIEYCELDEHRDDLIANIVPFYPDLEVLSLKGPNRLKSDDYCLIAQLKKLSELNLTTYEVDYMYVQPYI